MNAPKGVEKHVTMHDFPAYADMAKKHVDWWTFRGPADGASHKPTVLTVDPGTVKYAEVDIGRLLSFLWRNDVNQAGRDENGTYHSHTARKRTRIRTCVCIRMQGLTCHDHA